MAMAVVLVDSVKNMALDPILLARDYAGEVRIGPVHQEQEKIDLEN